MSHNRQIYAEFRRTGKYPVPGRASRPSMEITLEEIRQVLDTHKGEPVEVLRTAARLRGKISTGAYVVVWHW